MSWQDVARVLDTQCTLEETLYQVAPRAKDYHHKAESQPCRHREHLLLVEEIADGKGCRQYENGATDAAFP